MTAVAFDPAYEQQAAAELAAVVQELERREAWRLAIRGDMFDRQLLLYDDPAQFRAAHPGRRSGKSEFIPRAALLDVIEAGFEETVVIGAESQKKAKALHWHKLERMARRAGVPLVGNKTEGTFRTPWGAVILFWGITDQGAVDLLRGFKVKSAYFDEVATYASQLKYLCRDVMEPALSDTGGTLTLCGTPSVTRAGEWFEICAGSEAQNWSVHHWTMLQNPCFPRDAKAALAAAALRLGGEDSATYQREWLGMFVDDPGMQVYRYLASRNDRTCVEPPGYNVKTWSHTIATDYGTKKDACAWGVLTSAPHSKVVWVLRAFKLYKQLPDEAAKVTGELCERYKPDRLVGDLGGLGSPYGEEWNRRHAGKNKLGEEPKPGEYSMPGMICADKADKRAGIEFVNNELCAERLLFCQPACKPLTGELQSLPWADDNRLKEHASFENHCCDTLLYGEKHHLAYLNEAPDTRLADRDPDEAMAWQEAAEAHEGAQAQAQPDWERF